MASRLLSNAAAVDWALLTGRSAVEDVIEGLIGKPSSLGGRNESSSTTEQHESEPPLASMMSHHRSAAAGGGGPPHWEAASAFYLFVLTAVGALFMYALLTHPPTVGPPAKRTAGKSSKPPLPVPSSAPTRSVQDGASSARRGKVSNGECRAGDDASSRRRGGGGPRECLERPEDAAGPVDEASFLRSTAFPDSTPAERRRFLDARDGDVEAAAEMFRKYLDWRKEHLGYEKREAGKHKKTDSEYHWACACEVASRALGETPSSPPPSVLYWAEDDRGRPERSRDGRRILQHLPARIDTNVASGRFYALALALFLDRTLDRTSDEKFCVVIDARPGTGWGNVPAPKLVSFIKHAASLLNGLHPERLAQCVLFPVPFWAKGLWNMIRPFLDPDTAGKICLVSGSDKVDSEPPSKLTKYLDGGVVDLMERKRLSCFEEEGAAQ